MIQRSKFDAIFQSFWKTSFVTFLRDMSGKDWNPIFRIDRLNISRRKNVTTDRKGRRFSRLFERGNEQCQIILTTYQLWSNWT